MTAAGHRRPAQHPRGRVGRCPRHVYIADSDNHLIRKVDTDRHHLDHRRRHRGSRGGRHRQAASDPAGDSAGDGGPATAAPSTAPGHRRRHPGQHLHRRGDRRPHPPHRPVRHHQHHRRDRHHQRPGPGGRRPRPGAGRRGPVQHHARPQPRPAGNLWISDSKNNLVRVLFDPAHAPALAPPPPPPAGRPGGRRRRRGRPQPAAAAATGCSAWTARSTPSGTPSRSVTPAAPCRGTKTVHIEPTPPANGLLDPRRPGHRLRLRRRPAPRQRDPGGPDRKARR